MQLSNYNKDLIKYGTILIPKSNSFKTGEENKNYVSEIKNFYNQDLDNDYKYFLELYKEYKEKFVKKINLKNVDC